MNAAALKVERRFLVISAVCNLLLGCLGITFFLVSSSQAILLDGLFNMSYFATGLFTVKVASLVVGGDDERFPHGYAFFESLVNGVKGMLVLGVSVMAIVGAVQAMVSGGRSIAAGPAVFYGITASIICWAIAWFSRRVVKTTNSPLVRADMENWFVNAAISSCVLLAFAAIFLFESLGLNALVPYVDPTVVLAVVAVSLAVPVRMAWNSLMQLLNRAPDGKVIDEVVGIVDMNLMDLPVKERFIRVIQPGRQRMVLVHVVLPTDYKLDGLRRLDEVRAKTQAALENAHVATILDMLFTADRQWGAPLSDGGAGSSIQSNLPESVDLKSTAEPGAVPNQEQATGSVSPNVSFSKTNREKLKKEPQPDENDVGDHRNSRIGNDCNRPNEQGIPGVCHDSEQGQNPDRDPGAGNPDII